MESQQPMPHPDNWCRTPKACCLGLHYLEHGIIEYNQNRVGGYRITRTLLKVTFGNFDLTRVVYTILDEYFGFPIRKKTTVLIAHIQRRNHHCRRVS